MITDPIFINGFQKGSQENANLGLGKLVGVETYSKKGVAQLSRDTVKVSGTVVTGRITYFAIASTTLIYAQDNDGEVYRSVDAGLTWTNISSATAGAGNGIFFYEGFLFAFVGTTLEYFDGSWHNFKTGLANVDHPSFLFLNDKSTYFGNGSLVGILGFGTAPAFNPAGTADVDYFYRDDRLSSLPSFYRIRSISFLNPNYIALGTSSSTNDQVADLLLWNPNSSVIAQSPLRLYSNAQEGENGIIQLINRNNILYAVTGGSHSIFETNGTTFRLVANLSLHSDIRRPLGAQAQVPVFLRPRPGAIDVFGNKLLTGTGTPGDIGDYPTGYGAFPIGVWSVAFTEQGEAIQCEYTISTGSTTGVSRLEVTAIKCLNSNKTLIAWRDGNNTYGIDMVSTNNFQNDIGTVFIESEMMEIGTPLNPATAQAIQLNLPRVFLEGQTIRVNYRTSFDQDFTLLQSFTLADGVNTGANSGYKVTLNPIGATKYLQLQIQMATSTPNLTWSPELRNVIVAA